MGGCRCSYKTCTNTSKTRENLHFFHYPVKQKERCRQWIENAQKPNFFNLDEDQLRNKVICETHFADCFFPNIQKKRLLQGAIPTLDGDCVAPPVERVPLKNSTEVRVLPASDDGTLFILETQNLHTNINPEPIETYIYTDSGLVLPINKCNNFEDIHMIEIKDEVLTERHKKNVENVVMNYMGNESNYMFHQQSSNGVEPNLVEEAQLVEKTSAEKPSEMSDDVTCKAVDNKYVKKIKQHSKDIAFLKRMIKSQNNINRKPSNAVILNMLKRQLPESLFTLVNYNMNRKYEISNKDMEFFSSWYETSPAIYKKFVDKYKWKLPSPDTLQNCSKNNRNN